MWRTKMHKLTCEFCWEEFTCEKTNQRFCSRKCFWEYKKSKSISVCMWCWKEFYNPRHIKCCSPHCWWKFREAAKSKEEKDKIKAKQSKSIKEAVNWWDSKKKEEWIAKITIGVRKHFDNLTVEDRVKLSNAQKKVWENKTDEEKNKTIERLKYYSSHVDKSTREKMSVSQKIKWDSMSDEEKHEATQHLLDKERNKYSKTNECFEQRLNENWINTESEFYLWWFYYDFKIWNILVELNPTISHDSSIWFPRQVDSKPKDKDYHIIKTRTAVSNWYRCIMVWDWDDRTKILDLLKSDKINIWARECKVRELTYENANEFINENHLQWNTRKLKTNIYLWLYHNDKLVECMGIGKPRYNKNYEREILRLCTRQWYKVLWWANKLFKYFLDKVKPTSVVSYCDMSKFTWTVYKQLWFKLLKRDKPRVHRYNKQLKKHISWKLLLDRWVDQITWTEYGKWVKNEKYMENQWYLSVYDCWQSVYVYTTND